MHLIERLRVLVDSAPPDATVPVRWIAELLDQNAASVEVAISGNGSDPLMPDLTVDDVMGALRRERSTVIGWIHNGDFPGAYKLNGREWRIPRADWEAFLNRKRQGSKRQSARMGGTAVDLGAWRKHFGREEVPR